MTDDEGHVTLRDVAKLAGVSLATASRALHGAPGRRVAPALARQVSRAAAALGYSVNAPAQAMARGDTATVGLIVHDIADPYAAAIASGVIAEATLRGLVVQVAATLSESSVELRQLRLLQAHRAHAVILAGSRLADADITASAAGILRAIAARGGRVAAIGRNQLGVNTIAVGNTDGALRLARTLHALGYRRFAILSGPEQILMSEDRVAGFRDGLRSVGIELPDENLIGAQYTRDGGYVAMTELLDRGIDVEVVFAVSDVMALGAIAALREQGHRVPEDLAVAGFDDVQAVRDVQPALTTVRLPLVDIGRQALDLALSADPDGEPVVRPIHCDVVVRDSTPPRGS